MEIDLTTPQLRSIKKGAILGRTLQKDIPEIAQDYINGFSKSKIIRKWDIESTYNVGTNVAQNAVACHIRGHQGQLGVEAYGGSIPKEKLEELASAHQAIAFNSIPQEQRIARGKKLYKDKKGIHGFTKEQRQEISSNGGVISRDKKLGFHSFTQEQKQQQQRKAMIASGLTPYLPGEKQRIFELKDDPNFQSGKKGPSYNMIKQQINIEFHEGKEIRTRSSINYVLFRASKP